MNTFNYFKFPIDSKIEFDLDGKIKGTGTVSGFAMDTLNPFYIITLDNPIEGQKAILVPESLMKIKLLKSNFGDYQLIWSDPRIVYIQIDAQSDEEAINIARKTTIKNIFPTIYKGDFELKYSPT